MWPWYSIKWSGLFVVASACRRGRETRENKTMMHTTLSRTSFRCNQNEHGWPNGSQNRYCIASYGAAYMPLTFASEVGILDSLGALHSDRCIDDQSCGSTNSSLVSVNPNCVLERELRGKVSRANVSDRRPEGKGTARSFFGSSESRHFSLLVSASLNVELSRFRC